MEIIETKSNQYINDTKIMCFSEMEQSVIQNKIKRTRKFSRPFSN